MQTLRTQISTTVYSQVLIHTAERTGTPQSEQTCPRFETAAQDFNPDSLSQMSKTTVTVALSVISSKTPTQM